MKYNLKKPSHQKAAKIRFNDLLRKNSRIEMREYKPPRTNSQNKYLHVCIGLMAKEAGYTLEEMKTVLKRDYGLIYDKNGDKFLMSTAQMDSGQLTGFIDYIRRTASEVYSLYIPSPDEADFFELEKALEE